MSVNRTELVAEIAKKAGLSKTEADGALSAFQEILIAVSYTHLTLPTTF